MHICIYRYTYIGIHTCIYTHRNTFIYRYTYLYIYIYIHIYACRYNAFSDPCHLRYLCIIRTSRVVLARRLPFATHCNTLQHTATHYNTLQHTATLCYTLLHTATCSKVFARRLPLKPLCKFFTWWRRGSGAICCSVLQCVALCPLHGDEEP